MFVFCCVFGPVCAMLDLCRGAVVCSAFCDCVISQGRIQDFSKGVLYVQRCVGSLC